MQWFGPYKIFKNYENGSMELQDFESNIHPTRYNGITRLSVLSFMHMNRRLILI